MVCVHVEASTKRFSRVPKTGIFVQSPKYYLYTTEDKPVARFKYVTTFISADQLTIEIDYVESKKLVMPFHANGAWSATRFSCMLCSKKAFAPASTKANPSVELTALAACA